jgi:hypothetical protein
MELPVQMVVVVVAALKQEARVALVVLVQNTHTHL